jgi:ribosomal subunit interface protein
MEVRIKTNDFTMSEEVGAYLDERLAHVEKLLGDTAALARCEVEIGRDAGKPRHGEHIWFAEITVIRPGEETLRATNRAESINGAIDDVRDEMSRQIKSEKQIHRRFMKKSGELAKRLLRLQ